MTKNDIRIVFPVLASLNFFAGGAASFRFYDQGEITSLALLFLNLAIGVVLQVAAFKQQKRLD